MRRCVPLCALFWLLAACRAPAPPTSLQLRATPGPGVVVTDRSVETAAFRLRYPAGWRVVTGAEDAPPTVIIVAPDDRWLMLFSAAPPDAGSAPAPRVAPGSEVRTDTRAVPLADGSTVHALGAAPAAEWGDFAVLFERAVGSLRAL